MTTATRFYHYAAIDPRRTYRLRGRAGDAALPERDRLRRARLTDAGARGSSACATIATCEIAADGSFELVLSPDRHDGDWLKLDHDAVALVTRDYLVDPVTGRRCEWSITTDGPAPPPRHTDADTARRIRAATAFLRELFGIFPLALDPAKANTVDEPYAQPPVTYGWAAGDAAYAMGSFDLAPDQALVIEGTSPPCAFWNLCLWNPFLQTFDYRHERVTINGGQLGVGPGDPWSIVVAHEDPGVPAWLSTAGHRRGLLWFRWFLADELPSRPRTRVVDLAELRSAWLAPSWRR